MHIRLWLQKPPRVQWVLKVTDENEEYTASARTWFDEYSPDHVPPPYVVIPAALMCARIVAAVLGGPIGQAKFQVDIK